MLFLRSLLARWTWLMAWRDSRRSRRRLLLYASSIVLGIAALTANWLMNLDQAKYNLIRIKRRYGYEFVITRDQLGPMPTIARSRAYSKSALRLSLPKTLQVLR